MKYYTGIGSRKTPKDIQEVMRELASVLERNGYVLRSGGADGADTAFESGVQDERHKEIYLPWPKFNGSNSKFDFQSNQAFELASKHHPNWNNLKQPAKKLMARNCYQVLGMTLMPQMASSFLVCWTPDACHSNATRTSHTGGTGLAISLAEAMGVEVINLANQNQLKRIKDYINKMKEGK